MDSTDLRVKRILLGGSQAAHVTDDWPDREDWPVHKPAAPNAPIPGRHWYGGCEPAEYDYELGRHVGPGPRVRPDGVCEGCGEEACPDCGAEFYPDGGCQCTPKQP